MGLAIGGKEPTFNVAQAERAAVDGVGTGIAEPGDPSAPGAEEHVEQAADVVWWPASGSKSDPRPLCRGIQSVPSLAG